jgi:hypothetical protein
MMRGGDGLCHLKSHDNEQTTSPFKPTNWHCTLAPGCGARGALARHVTRRVPNLVSSWASLTTVARLADRDFQPARHADRCLDMTKPPRGVTWGLGGGGPRFTSGTQFLSLHGQSLTCPKPSIRQAGKPSSISISHASLFFTSISVLDCRDIEKCAQLPQQTNATVLGARVFKRG